MRGTLRLGFAQLPVGMDKGENLRRACEAVSALAGQGAELAVLPEMFCCPYSNEYFRDYAEPAGGPVWRALSQAARDGGLWLVGGSMPELDQGRVYNTSFVFDPQGNQAARCRKTHLFDIDVRGGQRFRESDTFTPGDRVTVFDTPWGPMGLCICFDMRFPEVCRLMALGGARLVVVPAAFNMTTGPAHWETLFRQRAVDNQLFTVGVAPARDEAGVYVSYGNSMVCSPWGEVLARAGAGPALEVLELDLDRCQAVREQLPLLSARRTDLYRVEEV